MRQIKCPVCGSTPRSDVPQFETVRCVTCQTTWTFIINEIDQTAMYQDEVYEVVDNRRSIFEKIILWEAKRSLQKAERFLGKNQRKLLDFGAGKGHFLLQAKDMGWDGLGVETSRARADFARENYGLEISGNYYERGPIGTHDFDFISLNHVLEHLPEPMRLLSELTRSNLESSGILMIEVPRIDSWQARIAGKDWMHLDIPKHLTHWSQEGLVSELEKLDLEPCAKRKYSIHLGVLGMLQALLVNTGYRENIILALKRKKSLSVVARVLFLLPFALLLEGLSVPFDKSGIIGIYFTKKNSGAS